MCCSSHAGTFCSALLERGVLDLTLKLPLGNKRVPSLGLTGPGVTPQTGHSTADLGGKSGALQRLKCARVLHCAWKSVWGMREGLKRDQTLHSCWVGEQHGVTVAWRDLGDT